MTCILQPDGILRDNVTGAVCEWTPTWPGTPTPPPVVVPTTTVLSPSTVWTGQGVYSRTLQGILSGLALWRGQPAVPTATQLIQQQQPGYSGGYGGGYGNTAALPGGSPGTNFSGQFQALIERHPGYVAIALAITGAFAIGALKPKRAGVR